MNRKTSTNRPQAPSQAMAQELRDFTALGRQILWGLDIDFAYLPKLDALMEQIGRAAGVSPR